MDKVVETLMELATGVDTERAKAKALGQKRAQECAKTVRELETSIRDNNRNVVAAQEDLTGVSADVEGLTKSVDNLKKQIKAGASEIDKLAAKLKVMRKKKSMSLSQADMTLQQVEAVIRKASMEEQREKYKQKDSPLKAQVSLLHQLGTKLSDGDPRSDDEPSPSTDSFLQTESSEHVVSSASSKQGDASSNVKGLLQADQQNLMEAKENADRGFDETEAKFEELLKIAHDQMKKLEDSLADTQPSLADKLRRSAEVNASRIMALRGLDRDKGMLLHVKAKCKFLDTSVEQLNTLRFQLSDLLRMPAKLLKKMDAMMFLARDLQSLRSNPEKKVTVSQSDKSVSFLQEGSQVTQQTEHGGKYREHMRALLWDEKEPDEAPRSVPKAPHRKRASTASETSDKGLGMVQEDGANAGPFDEVTAMIKSLVASLKDEANADTNRRQWCADNQAGNTNERVKEKDALDSLTSEVRWAKTAITRLDTEMKFLKAEVPRLQKAGLQCVKDIKAENDLVKSLDADQREASTILMKVEIVVKELCSIEDGKFLLLQRNSTTWHKHPHGAMLFLQRGRMGMRNSRFNNCVEGLKIIRKALLKSSELNKATKEYFKQFTNFVLAYKKKVDSAQVEQVASLNAASAAKAKRGSELAKAQHDESQKKKILRLLVKTKAKLEETCGPKVESPEDRLKRRSDEIEALKNALNVLEGQAIPV
eukprot:CAMPEP_0172671678 /NCGR_PEP_ID=MMETSP1074-20121228/11062_1 /TAXON_ID=2916 /ORGANISM="Ceratium fusus, Strain PA161109" /LENGTH=706 /DNA_ID=CAMNT_0013488765 /DNA_START=69 /DNA_END=2189 /DNA_ORIENTATION=-